MLIPVSKQNISSEKLFDIISEMQNKFEIPVYNSESGYSLRGIDLGSNNFRINKPVKVALLIGEGVNSYEAGEVWHLLDTRIGLPLTKLKLNQFSGTSLDKYTTVRGNLLYLSTNHNLEWSKISLRHIVNMLTACSMTLLHGVFRIFIT